MNVYKRCECEGDCGCHYHLKFEHEGRRIRESTSTANYKIAVRIANRRYNQVVGKAAGVGPVEPIRARLSELITRYGAFADGAHAAPHRTKSRMQRFASIFPARDPLIVDISPFDLERFRSQLLKDGLTKSTVQTEYMAVKGMFREAETWYPGYTRPDESVELWDLDDPEMHLLTADELKTTLTGLSPFLARICKVTLQTLARLDEVLGLDMNEVGADWMMRRVKGGKRIRVAIPPDLATELQTHKLPGQRLLFGVHITRGPRRDTIGKMSQPVASCLFRRELDKLGFPHIHHHLYRHRGVTLMLDRGVNPRAIQRLAGWTSLRMLEQYGHVRDAEMRRAVDGNAAAMQDFITGQSAEAETATGQVTIVSGQDPATKTATRNYQARKA